MGTARGQNGVKRYCSSILPADVPETVLEVSVPFLQLLLQEKEERGKRGHKEHRLFPRLTVFIYLKKL